MKTGLNTADSSLCVPTPKLPEAVGFAHAQGTIEKGNPPTAANHKVIVDSFLARLALDLSKTAKKQQTLRDH